MGIWIARDKDNSLGVYKVKPERRNRTFDSDLCNWIGWLDDDDFPEVTWKNSPKELIVKEDKA